MVVVVVLLKAITLSGSFLFFVFVCKLPSPLACDKVGKLSLVDHLAKTSHRADLGKCTHQYDENKETIVHERFDKNCLLRVQEERQQRRRK